MNSLDKMVAIIFSVAIGLPMIGMALSEYHNANVKVACYAAMKDNPKLECNK